MSYSGYDIEDAIVMNKASIDRGFARIMYIRRYGSGLKRYPNGATDSVNSPPEIPKEK
jgi:DNA-directed RNA polymerase III subunit RPC2